MLTHRVRLSTIGVCLAGVALLFAASLNARDVLLLNESASMPRGFYMRDSGAVDRGAIVTVSAVNAAPAESLRRHFTARGHRFIKRVAAIGGDRVCGLSDRLLINDRVVAIRKEHGADGRALARWNGCVTLDADHVLLLGNTGNSFDGRYWGPINRNLIEGVWRRL